MTHQPEKMRTEFLFDTKPIPKLDSVLTMRFFANISKKATSKNSCWMWDGYVNKHGYGIFSISHGKFLSHRVSYEYFIGEIPKGLVLDHKCRTPLCVNPHHLRPMTSLENLMIGKGMRTNCFKTHCPKGHPYSGKNLSVRHRSFGINRKCKACECIRAKKNYYKLKDLEGNDAKE